MAELSIVFWGALGGGIAVGIIELIRWLNSRPLLKVEVQLGNIVGSWPKLYIYKGPLEQVSCVFLSARNPHNVPVTVSRFGLYYKGRSRMILQIIPHAEFPYEIAGGKELQEWTDIQGLMASLREEGHTPSDLKGAWFKTSAGKEFRCRIDGKIIVALEKAFQAEEDTRQGLSRNLTDEAEYPPSPTS